MLSSNWVMFDHEKSSDKNYEKCTKKISTFNSIEKFWTSYLEYPEIETIFYKRSVGKPYYICNNEKRVINGVSVFKENIFPEWEDPKNKTGGEILIKDMSFENHGDLNKLWEKVLVFYISDDCKFSEYINGVRIVDSSVIGLKKEMYKIEVWFSNNQFKDDIIKEFKNLVKLDAQVFFKSHS